MNNTTKEKRAEARRQAKVKQLESAIRFINEAMVEIGEIPEMYFITKLHKN